MTRRVRIYVVWGLLAALAAAVYVRETREREPYIASEDQRKLFAFKEEAVGQVDLFFRGRLASFLRSPGGRWFQHDGSHRHNPAPEAGAAVAPSGAPPLPSGPIPAGAQAAGSDAPHPEPDERKSDEIGMAISFLARTVFDRKITPTEPLKEYGLDNPQIVVIFYPRNADNSAGPSPLISFYVGSPLSHDQSYYAQLSADRDIALIPLYQVNTLTQLAYGEVAQAPQGAGVPNPTNR